jgi:hypothetical protein
MPATSRRDLAIKVKIYEDYGDGAGADEIVRDVQRLIVMPDERLARVLASAGRRVSLGPDFAVA